ncbi:hypothetical protein ACFQ36_12415, partial [Arthrobacter sp. GCM10027362]|uniref:hypothetical protein n=1 Tax=Arthrobacter sp. GCM10027362 TaxID=3273379 RepID=UPI00363CC722
MTIENSAADPGAPRRQRMAEYRPLTQQARQNQQDGAANDVGAAGTLPAAAESSAAPQMPVAQAPAQA